MLDGLFDARRVAVVGVSPSESNHGRRIVLQMHAFGYDGELFLVGRGGGEVGGRPILGSLDEIPGEIDMAILLVPLHMVTATIEGCGRKGARWVILETAGYSEFGAERAAAEEEIRVILRRYGMRLVGPNCLGVINMANGLAAPFAPLDRRGYRRGPVSVVSQSGGIAMFMAETVGVFGPGLNKFVSVGNKLDLDEVDYLDYLARDPSTEVIAFYLEDFKRGEAFVKSAQRCPKPILLYKANVSVAGARVARSHTAALASDDRLVDAALREAGVLRVRNFRELAIASGVLRLPSMAGNRLAVICNSGGFSVVLADLCEEAGFVLPQFDPKLLSEIESWGRAGVIRLANPLDMGDTLGAVPLRRTIEDVLALPEVDGAIVTMTTWFWDLTGGSACQGVEAGTANARMLNGLSQRLNKPIVLANSGDYDGILEASHAADFPIIANPEDAVSALRLLCEYSKRMANSKRGAFAGSRVPQGQRDVAAKLLASAALDGKRELGMDCLPVLAAYDVPIVEPHLVSSAADAGKLVATLGVPVAMKVRSPDVLHKSDAGGVRLDVVGGEAAASAYQEIIAAVRRHAPEARLLGVDVQPMVEKGWEVIVGGRRDAQFGPAVLFGLGGIYAEALDEVALRLAPLSPDEAKQMIAGVRAGRLLSGLRGQQPADIVALANLIAQVSQLISDHSQIVELDLNPVKVLPEGQGVAVVDARLILNGNGM